MDFLTKCFEGDTLIGKLMHDFSCTNAVDMYYGILTLEKIAEYAGLPLDEVKKLKAERTA